MVCCWLCRLAYVIVVLFAPAVCPASEQMARTTPRFLRRYAACVANIIITGIVVVIIIIIIITTTSTYIYIYMYTYIHISYHIMYVCMYVCMCVCNVM